MVSENKGLVGKRVYRMSSYAPNRGTVNPSGYVKRELKKQGGKVQPAQKAKPLQKAEPTKKAIPQKHGVSKTGGDGESDTRSGLAKRMLPGSQKKEKRMYTGPGSKFAGPKKTAPVKIGANGVLKLPFDYQASAQALQAQQKANEGLLGLQESQQQQALAYLQQMRGAGQAYGQQKANTLNGNAARGTTFSSAHGLGVARDATGYNNQVNDLNAQNTQANNAFLRQRNQIQTDFNDFLRQQALARGVKLQSQAGTLGLGGRK